MKFLNGLEGALDMERVLPLRKKIAIWLRRFLKWVIFVVLAYLGILLIGLIPVNNDFEQRHEGIEIFVVSSAVHADIILPGSTARVVDWHEKFSDFHFNGDISTESHVAFGWGDRGFFLETETWDDFKIATAVNALLLPSSSCIHVSFTRPENYSDAKSVIISVGQYQRLVDYIISSFNLNGSGNIVQIEGYAYSGNDAFVEANGRYHILNTCNSWVGHALKTCGVRVPWLSPMPKTPMLYIPSKNNAK